MDIEKRAKRVAKIMKILFIPYGEYNAYHRLLVTALRQQGVETKKGQVSKVFSLVMEVIREKDIDIIHIVWTHPFFLTRNKVLSLIRAILFILDLYIIKILGIKIVWTVHNKYNHEKQNKNIDLFVSKILGRISNIIKVECICAKFEIIKLFNIQNFSKIEVIPEGSYIGAYPNNIDREHSRGKLGLKPEEFIFLHFGLIRHYKGIPELIDAFKRLNSLQSKLLIVGMPYTNEIADDILMRCKGNKNIKIIFKYIPDNEIQIYMNASDIVVLPYRDILTSGAILLAISFGKPVIAPVLGCIPDVLDDKGSFLYDISEEDGLLKAMRYAIDADLKKMGKHNYELAKQLNWDNISKRIYNVYLSTQDITKENTSI